VTVTVDVVVRLPLSATLTQYVPGFSLAVSCAVPPATADEVELATVHEPLLDGPMPRPSGLSVGGATCVSVTATLPAVVTLNVNVADPPGATVPEKESVVGPEFEGDDGELLKGLVHAEAVTAAARSSAVQRER
jgi:hypothetical protein